MNVDVITGIVIPIEVEIINYIVHGKIKNFLEDIKSTGHWNKKQVSNIFCNDVPVTRAEHG